MMSHFYSMPFGAEVQPDGSTRFRLWAPQAERVQLCLEVSSGEKLIPMEDLGEGWFEFNADQAGAGALYRFKIDDEFLVPDPASRYQPHDVHGASAVVDPRAFEWQDDHWEGVPWEKSVFYELHVGTFTPEGTFAAAAKRLDYLIGLGVTAVQLMPLGDFPGKRNWGYDGVLLFAPDNVYGRPETLKQFVQEAHLKGLMVFLDVVYNHFGPEGNYLHVYARSFFTERYQTPWGAGINFDGPRSEVVRDFYIHNALYWLEEYCFDGLRFDAVHAIRDDSRPNILEELAGRVHKGPGRKRYVHLVLENDENTADYLKRDHKGDPLRYVAQWNDDIHHSLHCIITGEVSGYYADYAESPIRHLGKSLTEGFAYQGESSPYRNGAPRGQPSKDLPPTAFVSFLQNHDQIGNRAFGDRIVHLGEERALQAAVAISLLAPSPPLVFMGEEFGCRQPFLFFCDFDADLAKLVTVGRREEFAEFPEFTGAAARERIPDPNSVDTFKKAILDWSCLKEPFHEQWLSYYRLLLSLRQGEIVPRLKGIRGGSATFQRLEGTAIIARWLLGDDCELTLAANLGDEVVTGVVKPKGTVLFEHKQGVTKAYGSGTMPPWSVAWFLNPTNGEKRINA